MITDSLILEIAGGNVVEGGNDVHAMLSRVPVPFELSHSAYSLRVLGVDDYSRVDDYSLDDYSPFVAAAHAIIQLA